MSNSLKPLSPALYWLSHAAELQSFLDPTDPTYNIVFDLLYQKNMELLECAVFCSLDEPGNPAPITIADCEDGTVIDKYMQAARQCAYYRLCEFNTIGDDVMLVAKLILSNTDLSIANSGAAFTLVAARGANKRIIPCFAVLRYLQNLPTLEGSGTFDFKSSSQSDSDLSVLLSTIDPDSNTDTIVTFEGSTFGTTSYDNEDYQIVLPTISQQGGGQLCVNFYYVVDDRSF